MLLKNKIDAEKCNLKKFITTKNPSHVLSFRSTNFNIKKLKKKKFHSYKLRDNLGKSKKQAYPENHFIEASFIQLFLNKIKKRKK